MDYLLDTNILIIYSRSSSIAKQIELEHNIFDGENNLAISVVTVGEINSLIEQNNFGLRRQNDIKKLIDKVFKIDINVRKVMEAYGKIDAYSQGRLKEKPLKNSARNMGKNDLWIAATAHAFDMVLITTDKDFEHLDESFVKLKYIDISKYKKR